MGQIALNVKNKETFVKIIAIAFFSLVLLITGTLCYRSVAGSNASNTSKKNDNYSQFVIDGIILNPDQVNHVKITDTLIIELPEIPSSGYLWHYKISASLPIGFTEENMFDFNASDVIGGTLNHVWKFKPSAPGSGEIVLKKYREWLGEESSVENYTFNMEIN